MHGANHHRAELGKGRSAVHPSVTLLLSWIILINEIKSYHSASLFRGRKFSLEVLTDHRHSVPRKLTLSSVPTMQCAAQVHVCTMKSTDGLSRPKVQQRWKCPSPFLQLHWLIFFFFFSFLNRPGINEKKLLGEKLWGFFWFFFFQISKIN